jgi:hypothetical protein
VSMNMKMCQKMFQRPFKKKYYEMNCERGKCSFVTVIVFDQMLQTFKK